MTPPANDVQHWLIPSNITPNGPLHVGHLSGPLLGGDVLRRVRRQEGAAASVLVGTAWQFSHVAVEARRRGCTVLEVAAEMGGRIETSFARAGVTPDYMLRVSESALIERLNQEAFLALHRAGLLREREGAAQYCLRCDDFRFEGFVDGTCPHCGSTDASGVDCEGCAHYHDDGELVAARCAVCDDTTVRRPVRRVYLELERLRPWLIDYLSTVVMDRSVRRFADEVLSRRLADVAISWPSRNAPAAPAPYGPAQRICPAFEIAARYVAMGRRHAEADAPATAPRRVTMLFGFDNAFERVFLMPAVLRGITDERAPLPSVMHMTYFALLDGAKFSTSRRHVIGLDDAIARYGRDELRLYVAARRPEESPANMSAAEIESSLEVRTVRALAEWARTGVARSPSSGTAGLSWRTLTDAAARLDQATTQDSLSCRAAAQSLTAVAAVAMHTAAIDGAFADPELHVSARRLLQSMATALIPDTAAALSALGRVAAAVR